MIKFSSSWIYLLALVFAYIPTVLGQENFRLDHYYQALLAHNIAASLHIFPQGGHVIALVNNPGSTATWPSILTAWLHEIKIIKP